MMKPKHVPLKDPCSVSIIGGQSLAEYSLIALLVIVVAIPVLMMFSGSINSPFLNMLGSSPRPKQVSGGAASSGMIPNVLGEGLGSSSGATGILQPTPLGMGLQQTVQTAGVNGATNMLADSIATVAQQKLAAGEIDQVQYNSLINLSNKGHRLATILGLIESAFSNSNGQEPYSILVQFEGQSVPIVDLANSIGYAGDYTSVLPTQLLSSDTANSNQKSFLDAYQSALNSGALNEPVIKQQIEELAAQIATMSSTLNMVLYDYDNSRVRAENITNQTASKLTNENSVTICQTGNGTDSGQQCQQ